MGDFLKATGRRRADTLGRVIGADQVGETRGDGVMTAAQGVIFGIANHRRVGAVVMVVMDRDFRAEGGDFGARLAGA